MFFSVWFGVLVQVVWFFFVLVDFACQFARWGRHNLRILDFKSFFGFWLDSKTRRCFPLSFLYRSYPDVSDISRLFGMGYSVVCFFYNMIVFGLVFQWCDCFLLETKNDKDQLYMAHGSWKAMVKRWNPKKTTPTKTHYTCDTNPQQKLSEKKKFSFL